MGVGRAAARTAGRRLHRARLVATALSIVVAPLVAASGAHAAAPFVGVVAVSGGDNHTCAVTTIGTVDCWGLNTSGQIGDGTITPRLIPHAVPNLTNIASLSSGSAHTCARTTGGVVYCWGLNDHGELVIGGTGNGGRLPDTVKDPVNPQNAYTNVAQIALGAQFSCLLTTTGRVQCWGRNDSGQLGVLDTTSRFLPSQVIGLQSGVAAIAAGGKNACALMTTGGVKCWGINTAGELGDPNNTTSESKFPVDVPGLAGVSAIAVGGAHACALISGAVKCWGANASGQVGNNSTSVATSPASVSGLPAGITAIAASG